MSGTINRAAFAAMQWPGIKRIFGMSYNPREMQCSKIFETKSSDKAYEEDVLASGFGLVPEKTEGGPISYDSHAQGYTKRYQHITYGMGYIITREEDEDNKYASVQKGRTRALANSFKETKETVHSNIFNRAFNSSYTGGDGKELLALDHPITGGTFANELSTPADLSEVSLEDLLILLDGAVDERGLQIVLKPKRLIVPRQLKFSAERIVGSERQSGTANNDINAMRSLGLFTDGAMVYHYLTDADAWFVQTDADAGLTCYQRRNLEFKDDSDSDTENRKYMGTERYSVGWSDPRCLFGSAGS